MAGFAALLDDGITWHESTPGFEGDYHGRDQALALLGRVVQEAGVQLSRISIHDILANDDHAVILQDTTLTRKGRTFTGQYADVYHLRDGKITEHMIAGIRRGEVVGWWRSRTSARNVRRTGCGIRGLALGSCRSSCTSEWGLLTPRRRERVAMSITDHPESASPPQASADRRANPAGGRALSRALALWAAVLALPLAALGLLLLAEPDLDMRWVSHQSHFWLVLEVAAVNVALGLVASEAATRRDDARTFFVSMALLTSAGFLGLHALATPGVLLDGMTAGFSLAARVGLLVAAGFAAISAVDPDVRLVRVLARHHRWLRVE